LDPRIQLAFQFASDLAKQLITLASAIIALSVTFAKDLLKSPTHLQTRLLQFSWVCYILSVIAGVWSLMALTGSLAPIQVSGPLTSIGANARLPAMFQICLFVLGTGLFLWLGIVSLKSTVQTPVTTQQANEAQEGKGMVSVNSRFELSVRSSSSEAQLGGDRLSAANSQIHDEKSRR
jgi:hypothetical protein